MPIFTNMRKQLRHSRGWKCQKCGGGSCTRIGGKRRCDECGWKNL